MIEQLKAKIKTNSSGGFEGLLWITEVIESILKSLVILEIELAPSKAI